MKLLMSLVYFLLAVGMVGVGILFSLQNNQAVPMDVLVYQFQPHSLALWILCAFAIGGVTGMLISSGVVLRLRASLRIARKQLLRAQSEVDGLRTAGLKDGE